MLLLPDRSVPASRARVLTVTPYYLSLADTSE